MINRVYILTAVLFVGAIWWEQNNEGSDKKEFDTLYKLNLNQILAELPIMYIKFAAKLWSHAKSRVLKPETFLFGSELLTYVFLTMYNQM